MKGVQFVVDDKGNTTSLLIDVNEIGEEWQDFIDGIIAESRKDEPLIPWEEVKHEIDRKNAVSH